MRFQRIIFSVFAVITLQPLSMPVNAQDAASRLQKVAQANSLVLPGKTPFHLKMSFQLYDLAGKPSDIGILEEWWAAPGESRTTIIASSLKQTEAVVFDDSLKIDPRERYLIKELLTAETRPLPAAPLKSSGRLDEVNRKFDKTTLHCFELPALDESTGADDSGYMFPGSFCTNPGTDILLLEFNKFDGHTIARKDLGTFHETSAPLELQVSYAGRLAVTGKVVQMQSFDPSAIGLNLSSPVSHEAKHYLVAAKVDKLAQADYPESAMESFRSGFVVLSGLITELGAVKDIFVIASSSPDLTQTTIDAFNHCKFIPPSRDGQAIANRIVFESTFAINGSSSGSGVTVVSSAPHTAAADH